MPPLFPHFHGVRKSRARRHESSYGTLYYRAQLWHQNGVTSPPEYVYHPNAGWWLLVTSLDETSPVIPATLLICLQNLRTLVEFDDTLFPFSRQIPRENSYSTMVTASSYHVLHQAKIRLLGKHDYTFENPATVQEALSIVHDCSTTNRGIRLLRRTVWQDRRAIFEHMTPPKVPDERPGKWLTTQPKIRLNYPQWISYDNTDKLQAPGIVV